MLRGIRLLGQREAQLFDEELFSDYAFSLDQLMELAGLAVATAVSKCFSRETHPKVLVFAGPGKRRH